MHNSMNPSISNTSSQQSYSEQYSLIPSVEAKTDRNQNTVGFGPSQNIGWANPSDNSAQARVSETVMIQCYKTDVSYKPSGMRSIQSSYNPSNYTSTNTPTNTNDNGISSWNSPSNSSSTYPASYSVSTTASYPYPPTPAPPSQTSRFQKTEFYTPSTLPVYPLSPNMPASNIVPNNPSSQPYSFTPTYPSSNSSTVYPAYPSSNPSTVYPAYPSSNPSTVYPAYPSSNSSTVYPSYPSSQPYSLAPTYPSSKSSSNVTPSNTAGQSYSLTPTYPSSKSSCVTPTYPSSKSSGVTPTYPSSKSSGVTPTYPSSKSSGVTPTYPSSKSSGVTPTYPSSKSSGVTPTYPSTKSSGKIPGYPSPTYPSSKSTGITPGYPPSKTPSNYPSKTPSSSPSNPSRTPTYPRSTANNLPSKKTTINVPIKTVTKKYSDSNLLSRLSSQSQLKLGEKGSGIRARGVVQDFHQLRAELLSSGELFEDNEFPAVDSSIFFSKSPPKPFEWKRPMEISENPKLFVDGATRFDVQQGELGDCWLLAAVANLTLHKGLFSQIVPDDQGFGDQYAGIFHFRFWQYGRWVDVVIDDRLPTYYGKLVFLHSSETNEFWSALLEKAYAKLHGSYEALKGGSTCEAMEDFTGGVTEMYEMNQAPPNLYQIMMKANERSSLMGCSIEPDPSVLEAQTRDGLVKGHAYSITRVKYVDIHTPNSSGKIPLIRLRNPWGNETEWKGAWSDKSAEWRFIPDHEKEEIGLTFEHDGEFWMSYQDFKSQFSRLEICNLNPDSLVDEDESGGDKLKWEMSMFEGEWVRGVTAGGCRNFLETFWHNPQYNITLNDPDEDDDDSKCTVIVALMQKNRRSQRRMGMECLTIGFAMYHLPDPANLPKPLDLNFFKYNASVARSPSFINLREVSCRFKLPPGSYCIVPSTFEANEEGEFILRVFSENKNNMEENDEEVGLGEVDQRVINVPVPEEDKAEDKVKEFFRKIAGEDMEVDWMELKEILDYAMRSELPSGSSSSQNGIVNMLLSLVCGAACKDTPLAQVFETKNEGFSKDVCRSMVAMMDVDRSGKLGFEEFKALWSDIRNWKGVFQLYDKDGSKCLSAFELRQALNSAGYRLNNHILNILAHRYSTKDGMITFDDFMMCAVRLKAMIDIFRERDPESTNTATFTMEEWVEKTLYS